MRYQIRMRTRASTARDKYTINRLPLQAGKGIAS
jgi:hypothetical protein